MRSPGMRQPPLILGQCLCERCAEKRLRNSDRKTDFGPLVFDRFDSSILLELALARQPKRLR